MVVVRRDGDLSHVANIRRIFLVIMAVDEGVRFRLLVLNRLSRRERKARRGEHRTANEGQGFGETHWGRGSSSTAGNATWRGYTVACYGTERIGLCLMWMKRGNLFCWMFRTFGGNPTAVTDHPMRVVDCRMT